MYSKRFVSKVSCPDMCIQKESILKKIFRQDQKMIKKYNKLWYPYLKSINKDVSKIWMLKNKNLLQCGKVFDPNIWVMLKHLGNMILWVTK